jgi:hypothetical protein
MFLRPSYAQEPSGHFCCVESTCITCLHPNRRVCTSAPILLSIAQAHGPGPSQPEKPGVAHYLRAFESVLEHQKPVTSVPQECAAYSLLDWNNLVRAGRKSRISRSKKPIRAPNQCDLLRLRQSHIIPAFLSFASASFQVP